MSCLTEENPATKGEKEHTAIKFTERRKSNTYTRCQTKYFNSAQRILKRNKVKIELRAERTGKNLHTQDIVTGRVAGEKLKRAMDFLIEIGVKKACGRRWTGRVRGREKRSEGGGGGLFK